MLPTAVFAEVVADLFTTTQSCITEQCSFEGSKKKNEKAKKGIQRGDKLQGGKKDAS